MYMYLIASENVMVNSTLLFSPLHTQKDYILRLEIIWHEFVKYYMIYSLKQILLLLF